MSPFLHALQNPTSHLCPVCKETIYGNAEEMARHLAQSHHGERRGELVWFEDGSAFYNGRLYGAKKMKAGAPG